MKTKETIRQVLENDEDRKEHMAAPVKPAGVILQQDDNANGAECVPVASVEELSQNDGDQIGAIIQAFGKVEVQAPPQSADNAGDEEIGMLHAHFNLHAPSRQQPAGRGEVRQDQATVFPWIENPGVGKQNFMDLVPDVNKRQRALQGGFMCEPFGDVSFRNRDWVTNWKSFDEITAKEFGFGQFQVVITEAEAGVLCRRDEATGLSMLTALRNSMKHVQPGSNILLPGRIPWNPFYRFVYFRARGSVIFAALTLMHAGLEGSLYYGMNHAQRQLSIPPTPPIHPANIRPMILTLHFNHQDRQVPVNNVYCCLCFGFDHVPGHNGCRSRRY